MRDCRDLGLRVCRGWSCYWTHTTSMPDRLLFIVILRNSRQYNDPMSTKKSVNLEKALADLEEIVEELESGDLPLEKAMKKFEEGIKLTRSCQAALKDAEQKVEILLKSAGGEELEDFEVEDD